MTNSNPSNWNTFAERPYTYDIADDQLSAGGVHLWQVRLGPTGWQKRIIQSNGVITNVLLFIGSIILEYIICIYNIVHPVDRFL